MQPVEVQARQVGSQSSHPKSKFYEVCMGKYPLAHAPHLEVELGIINPPHPTNTSNLVNPHVVFVDPIDSISILRLVLSILVTVYGKVTAYAYCKFIPHVLLTITDISEGMVG